MCVNYTPPLPPPKNFRFQAVSQAHFYYTTFDQYIGPVQLNFKIY